MDRNQAELIRAETPEAAAVSLVEDVLRKRHPLCIAYSSGKDSSTVVSICFTAAVNVAMEGIHTPIIITHSNTGVENPAVHRLAQSEMQKMREYAKRKALQNFEVLVGEPALSQSFAVRVIGGRAMPAYPSTRQDCSLDWKVRVQDKLRRTALNKLSKVEGLAAPIVVTGVRNGESIKRDSAVKLRGEVGGEIWANDKGELRLSPILNWDVDDVWTYLGLVNAGVIESYSDFSETMDLYRDAGGSSCVVVADMAMAAHMKPCTARTGCWSCTMVRRDASLRNMIESEPEKYGSLQLLSDFRDFLANVQYDWTRRNYVGRSIDRDGYIRIAADGFSPAMLEELLWYALSIQAETGHQIVSDVQLIAIDARWSQYGLNRPFEALRIAMKVADGERRFPPQIPEYPKTDHPDYGAVFVGTGWDDDITSANMGRNGPDEMTRRLVPTGLRDPLLEMAGECGVGTRELKSGRWVLDFEDGPDMCVDPEGASDFLQFIAPDLIAEYENRNCDWTEGFFTYLRYGTITLPKGQSWMSDAIVRRTQWRQRNGLHGQRTVEELLAALDVTKPRQVDLFSAEASYDAGASCDAEEPPSVVALDTVQTATVLRVIPIGVAQSPAGAAVPGGAGDPPKSNLETELTLLDEIFAF